MQSIYEDTWKVSFLLLKQSFWPSPKGNPSASFILLQVVVPVTIMLAGTCFSLV